MNIFRGIARFILLMLEGASFVAALAALITNTFKGSNYETWYPVVVFLCFICLIEFLDVLRRSLRKGADN